MKLYTFVPKTPQQIAICRSMSDAIDYAEDYKSTFFITPIDLNHKNDALHYQLKDMAEFSPRAWRDMSYVNGSLKLLGKRSDHVGMSDWFDRIQPILQMTEIIEK